MLGFVRVMRVLQKDTRSTHTFRLPPKLPAPELWSVMDALLSRQAPRRDIAPYLKQVASARFHRSWISAAV